MDISYRLNNSQIEKLKNIKILLLFTKNKIF